MAKAPSRHSKAPVHNNSKPAFATPGYRSRRTLADHVKRNMSNANTHCYMQRIIAIASHRTQPATEDALHGLHDHIARAADAAEFSESSHGLVVHYSTHSWLLVDAPEQSIGAFCRALASEHEQHFGGVRIVLVYANISRRMFQHSGMLYWHVAEATPICDIKSDTSLHDSEDELLARSHQLLVHKILATCQAISEQQVGNEMEREAAATSNVAPELSPIYVGMLPAVPLIDCMLRCRYMLGLDEFVNMFERIPANECYGEQIWPIAHDFTPDNLYDWGRYDINLIFDMPKQSTDPAT